MHRIEQFLAGNLTLTEQSIDEFKGEIYTLFEKAGFPEGKISSFLHGEMIFTSTMVAELREDIVEIIEKTNIIIK